MKIAVAGTGYVGLSIATLLAQHHQVVAVDVIPEKVEKINRRISPIQDEYIEKYLAEKELDLTATLDGESAYRDADFVVIAAPTNYDPVKNFFDTTHVEEVIELVLKVNPAAVMVIKSTVPVGYTRSLLTKYASSALAPRFLFSPEFLRESKALPCHRRLRRTLPRVRSTPLRIPSHRRCHSSPIRSSQLRAAPISSPHGESRRGFCPLPLHGDHRG